MFVFLNQLYLWRKDTSFMLPVKYAFIAALLLIPACIIAQAQAPAEDGTPKNKHVKVIRLDAKRYRADGEALLRLSGIKVIVLCADTSQLGYVQKGMANKAVHAVPDKPYTTYLQDFVNEVFGDVYVAAGRQMLWVIKDLRINEVIHPMSEQYAFVRLKADAYLPVNSSDTPTYRLLAVFDKVFVKGGMDVTHKHGKNIAEAIQQFYLACEDAASLYSSETPVTEADIVAKTLEPFNAPIFRDTAFKEGVYRTYEEFLANAPSITGFEVEQQKRKRRIVYTRSEDSLRKEVTAMWGICYKGALYKYDGEELTPIARQGNTFVLARYLRDLNKRNSSIFWSSVAAGISNGVPLWNVSTQLPLAKGLPEAAEYGAAATTVDVESGELVF